MKTKTTYTFEFKVDDRTYSFNQVATSKEEALLALKKDMGKMMAEISGQAI